MRYGTLAFLAPIVLGLLIPEAGWTQEAGAGGHRNPGTPLCSLRVSSVGADEIRLDGRLVEPEWREADLAPGFIRFQPDPGGPSFPHGYP